MTCERIRPLGTVSQAKDAELAVTVPLPKEGPVHDVKWTPAGDYFVVVAGVCLWSEACGGGSSGLNAYSALHMLQVTHPCPDDACTHGPVVACTLGLVTGTEIGCNSPKLVHHRAVTPLYVLACCGVGSMTWQLRTSHCTASISTVSPAVKHPGCKPATCLCAADARSVAAKDPNIRVCCFGGTPPRGTGLAMHVHVQSVLAETGYEHRMSYTWGRVHLLSKGYVSTVFLIAPGGQDEFTSLATQTPTQH